MPFPISTVSSKPKYRALGASTLPAVLLSLSWLLSSGIASASLVVYYDFEDGTNSATAADKTGGMRTGTLTGFNTATDWVAGAPGSSTPGGGLSLNGGQYIPIANGLPSQLGIGGANPKLVSMWANITAFTDDGLFDSGNKQPAQNWSLRTLNGVNVFRAQHWGGGNDYDFTLDGSGPQVQAANGNWVHYVHTYDGTTATTYADGVVVGSLNVNLNITDTLNFEWGRYNGVNGQLTGIIDDASIWDHALTPAEVSALYSGTSPLMIPEPSPMGLIGFGAVIIGTLVRRRTRQV